MELPGATGLVQDMTERHPAGTSRYAETTAHLQAAQSLLEVEDPSNVAQMTLKIELCAKAIAAAVQDCLPKLQTADCHDEAGVVDDVQVLQMTIQVVKGACESLAALARLLAGGDASMQDSEGERLGASIRKLLHPAQPLAVAVAKLGSGIAQVATEVLSGREVCRKLVAAGGYADAAQQMQQVVRVLYPALLTLQVAQVDTWGDEHLQGSPPSLAGPAVQQLVDLAVQVADNVASAGSGADIPKELASFSVLNLAWSSLTRAVAQGEEHRFLPLLVGSQSLANSMECALRQLVNTCMQLEGKFDANRLRVAKFWMQGVLKTGCASASVAVSLCWGKIRSSALSLYASLHRQCRDGGNTPYVESLKGAILPRFVSCVVAVLSVGGQDGDHLEPLLCSLMGSTEAARAQHVPGSMLAKAQQIAPQLQADHMASTLLCIDILQHSADMSSALASKCAQLVVPWALQALVCAHTGRESVEENSVLTAVLGFMLGCSLHEDRGAWHQGICELQNLALASLSDELARLATELLTCIIGASDSSTAQQLMSSVHAALTATALTTSPADVSAWKCQGSRLGHLLSSLLQASAPLPVQTFACSLSELDLGDVCSAAAAVLGWQSLLQVALTGCDISPPNFVESCLHDFGDQAHKALQILSDAYMGHAQRSLAQLHLGWLLEGMCVLGRLLAQPQCAGSMELQPCGEKAASLVGDCINAALHEDGIQTGCVGGRAHRQPPPYVPPALRVLAAFAQHVPSCTLASLLPGVVAVAMCSPTCLMSAAQVGGFCAGLPFQSTDLFHPLLSSEHWPVVHAAMDALVMFTRSCTPPGPEALALVPPALMASHHAAGPRFVAALAAHMTRRPDKLAVQAFDELQCAPASSCSGAALQLAEDIQEGESAAGLLSACIATCPQAEVQTAELDQTPLLQMLMPLLQKTSSCIAAAAQAVVQVEEQVGALCTTALASSNQACASDIAALSSRGAQLSAELSSIISRVRSTKDRICLLQASNGFM